VRKWQFEELRKLALIEGCKHQLEITIPSDAVTAEIERAAGTIQKKAHLKGFRPGKAPLSIVKQNFGGEIRQEAIDKLIPDFLEKAVEKEGLAVVSRPNVKDLHWHDDNEVHFKVEFEVNPTFELGEYRGLRVPYAEPVVTEEDIEQRLTEIRESKAEFVNVDPRPAQDGDHCLVALESISGVEGEPVRQDELNIEIGGKDTFEAFSNALRGAQPGDVVQAEITYPEEYAAPRLAGKTVQFNVTLKTIRLKELPELNDEFAKDLGDFQELGELKDEVRKSIFREREYVAQTEAKNKLVDALVDAHVFPVPEVFVDRQVESIVEGRLRELAGQGVDVKKLKLNWEEIRTAQMERATRDVRGSLLLGRIADVESIHVTEDEMDAQVQAVARSRREPVAAVRKQLTEDGTLNRIASRMRTDKVLNYLFEHAVKEAPAPAAAE
jgi:trigger factor